MNKVNESMLAVRTYQQNDLDTVIALWKDCGLLVPWNNPYTDIESKMQDSPGLFFVALLEDKLVGTCMAGFDGHRGWVYYMAVEKSHRNQGIARRLLAKAESSLAELGCAKLELMVRKSNRRVVDTYRALGFKEEEVSVLSKRLIEHESYSLEDNES